MDYIQSFQVFETNQDLQQEFIDAVKNNDVEQVKLLLKNWARNRIWNQLLNIIKHLLFIRKQVCR